LSAQNYSSPGPTRGGACPRKSAHHFRNSAARRRSPQTMPHSMNIPTAPTQPPSPPRRISPPAVCPNCPTHCSPPTPTSSGTWPGTGRQQPIVQRRHKGALSSLRHSYWSKATACNTTVTARRVQPSPARSIQAKSRRALPTPQQRPYGACTMYKRFHYPCTSSPRSARRRADPDTLKKLGLQVGTPSDRNDQQRAPRSTMSEPTPVASATNLTHAEHETSRRRIFA